MEMKRMKLYANVGPDGLIVFETHPDPTLGRLPVASVPLKDEKSLKTSLASMLGMVVQIFFCMFQVYPKQKINGRA